MRLVLERTGRHSVNEDGSTFSRTYACSLPGGDRAEFTIHGEALVVMGDPERVIIDSDGGPTPQQVKRPAGRRWRP